MRRPKSRGGLFGGRTGRSMLIALFMLPVGVQAALFPRSFFEDFPLGRGWVAATGGPYNEHLVRDNVGVLFVALIVATAWTAWTRARGSSARCGVDRPRCRSPRLPRRSPRPPLGRRASRPPRIADRRGGVGRRVDVLPGGQIGEQLADGHEPLAAVADVHDEWQAGDRRYLLQCEVVAGAGRDAANGRSCSVATPATSAWVPSPPAGAAAEGDSTGSRRRQR